MQAVSNMNGTIWIFAVIVIAFVVLQSMLFLRLALKFNKKVKAVTDEEIKLSFKTGAISAIGPAFSSVTIALSLIVMVGGATAFMRCGVIGSPAWELYMAQICSTAVGVTFGSEEFTESVFTLCLFGMTLASAGYAINTIISLKPLDNVVVKEQSKEKKRSFIPYLSNAAMMGIMGYSIIGYLSSLASICALVAAALTSIVIGKIVKATGNKTLAGFNMAICMIAAMFVGELVTVLIG